MNSFRFSHSARASVLAIAGCGMRLAHADEAADATSSHSPHVHLGLGAAHAVAGPQAQELGWGGGARLALELPLGSHFGLEAAGSSLSLSQGQAPEDPRYASRSVGLAWGASGGARVNAWGAWLSAGGGIVVTGGQVRPIVEARLGYDVRVGKYSAWTMGPFVGYTQIFQPSSDVRPEDAHIAWIGLEVSLGSRARAEITLDIAKKPKPVVVAAVQAGDRDHDLVNDSQDACPDVPGVPTADPATNGCPGDRDHDGIANALDACPDVAGIATSDSSTNGCPFTPMHLVGDSIELNDIIAFGFGSPDVRESSKPLVKKVAEYIVDRGDITSVEIEGHADEIGSAAYNVNLSRARANSVKKLLVEYGVTATLIVHAWGEAKPRSHGHDEVHLRQNRRVEFTVTRQHEEPTAAVSSPEDNAHASN